jgi:transcriptional regulator with XRE-family HTH domain
MSSMKEMLKAELNKGITQRDLAMRIGFSHSTIQKILFTDTKCTYETRKKVADYFRVPVSHFYDASIEAIPNPSPAPSTTSDLLFKALMDRIDAQGKALQGLQDLIAGQQVHINNLNETLDKLGGEIGHVKIRMIDAARSGDIHRLELIRSKKLAT